MCVVRIDFFTDDDTVTRNGLQFIEDVRRNGFILGYNRYLPFLWGGDCPPDSRDSKYRRLGTFCKGKIQNFLKKQTPPCRKKNMAVPVLFCEAYSIMRK